MSKPLTLAALCLAAACGSTAPSGPLTIISGGNYAYTAYSPTGVPVLEGTVHLEYGMMPAFRDPPRGLVGTWETHWIAGADQSTPVGPQVGNGQLDGETDDNGLQLSFLPNQVDNDVSLTGLVYGAEVSGTWNYSTIAGPSQHGRFTLVPER